MSITENLRPLHSNEPALHHLLQFRQESSDLGSLVHDLHDNRQIQGKSQDVRIVKVVRVAEAHRATQYRSASEMELSRSQHDCSVERAMHKFFRFPQEDSQQGTLFWQIPGLRDSRRLSGGKIADWLGHHESGKTS